LLASLAVAKGAQYEFDANGAWQIAKEGDVVSADGRADDRAGRLVGAIMTEDDGKNYQLSEPFDLAAKGAFTASADGKLYLCCQDKWGELTDNKGTLAVKLKAAKAN
jgi:hypothetical protein